MYLNYKVWDLVLLVKPRDCDISYFYPSDRDVQCHLNYNVWNDLFPERLLE
jgi:hypothetical protein